MSATSDEVQDVGYRRPPTGGRFKNGQSGNPKGRPRGSRRGLPYEAVLGQQVTIRENGVERRVSAAEAFLLQMTRSALAGDGPAGRYALDAIEGARLRRGGAVDDPLEIVIRWCGRAGVGDGLISLRMAVQKEGIRSKPRLFLEPWLIKEALARLGPRKLSIPEQVEVYRAARAPGRIEWPDWWQIDGTSVEVVDAEAAWRALPRPRNLDEAF